jgi:hypothetical protein
MILRGYFDESYDKNVFTLCCSLSNLTGWGDIERGWRNCLKAKNKSLRKHGRPEISRYHSSHANSRDHEFKGWSREERDELAIQLMNTLHRDRGWINTVSYSLPLQEVVKAFEIDGNPLPFCYREAVKFIMLEMSHQIDEVTKLGQLKPIKYVLFHERCDYDDAYLKGFNAMMADATFKGKELFSTIAPLGWEDCIPLQPADMIAYETFKDALRKFNSKDRRPSLDYLLQSGTFGGRSKQMTAKNVSEWREIVDQSITKKNL